MPAVVEVGGVERNRFGDVEQGEIAFDHRGFVEELPEANTQGVTLEEVRANLAEAVDLVFETNRVLAEETIL